MPIVRETATGESFLQKIKTGAEAQVKTQVQLYEKVLGSSGATSNTIFTLAGIYVPTSNTLLVFVNGQKAELNISGTTALEYVETDFQTITFKASLLDTDVVEFMVLGNYIYNELDLATQIDNTLDSFLRNYIDGLILSNGTDTEHDIDIAIGKCSSSDNLKYINLESILTKQIDVNWAEGTDDGGFPSGLTLAVDTWYHVFVITKTDGTVDAGFDTSLTATNLLSDATSYTKYRRIGSVLTDASSNIYQFIQFGDKFMWITPIDDIFDTATGTAEKTATIRVPLGLPGLSYYAFGSPDVGGYFRFYHPDVTDEVPSHMVGHYLPTANTVAEGKFVHTNSSSQIHYRSSLNGGLKLKTLYYIDLRGKE